LHDDSWLTIGATFESAFVVSVPKLKKLKTLEIVYGRGFRVFSDKTQEAIKYLRTQGKEVITK
jgi:hypothetical protein